MQQIVGLLIFMMTAVALGQQHWASPESLHVCSSLPERTIMLPTMYIPHGGGPLPVLGYPCHTALVGFLSKAAQRIPQKPKGIIVVSAHWEEENPTLTSGQNPGLMYDYYGFPPQSYQLQYAAPAHPQLAQQAASLLRAAGFNAALDPHRAWDHGVFIPLRLMYPDADIPVVEMSLKHSLDPQEHYAMGAALAPLRQQGILLLGSGMSFHGMSTLRKGMGQQPRPDQDKATLPGQDFNTWLIDACTNKLPAERLHLLSNWSKAPGARTAHPREEHLLPLMVVAGAAAADTTTSSSSSSDDSAGHVMWNGECMGTAVTALAFGNVVE